MYVVEFVRDISRFHKHGLLRRFCALPFMRIEVVVCCGVAIAILLFIFTLSYRGFCFSGGRLLSDSEYFAAAINQIIQRDEEQLISYNQSKISFYIVHVLKYADADEFQRQNPQCCKIVPHNVGDAGPYTSFFQRLFGYAAKIVSITYLVRSTDDTGGQKSTLKAEQFAVTNCGRAWR